MITLPDRLRKRPYRGDRIRLIDSSATFLFAKALLGFCTAAHVETAMDSDKFIQRARKFARPYRVTDGEKFSSAARPARR